MHGARYVHNHVCAQFSMWCVNRFLDGAGVHQPYQGSRVGGVLPRYSDRARAQHLGTQVKVLHGERTSRRGPVRSDQPMWTRR
jgi:hypothetical protein